MILGYKVRGFTLIELLVVLTISGVLMAFVGPVAIEQIDSSKAKAEIEQLKSIIRTASVSAYSKGEVTIIELESSTISKYNDKNHKLNFVYISFPKQRILFNRNGYSNQVEVSYRYNSHLTSLSIYRLLGYEEGEFTYAP
jgi:prepilin-type N-terminal cleavage/methylation domain-containing protein